MKRIVKSSIFALLIIFVLASLAHAKSTSQHITFMVTVLPAHHAYLPDHARLPDGQGQQTTDYRPSTKSDVSRWNTEKVVREGQTTLLYTMAE